MENELLRIDYTNVDRPTVLGRDLIQVYKNEQFGEVRMVVEGDKVLFCAKDVAAALGYAKPRNAITAHYRYAQSNKQGSNILRQQILKGGQRCNIM